MAKAEEKNLTPEEQAETKPTVTLEDVLAKMAEMEAENKEIRAELKEAKAETAKAKKTADAAAREQELTEGQKQVLMERKFHDTMEEAKKDTVTITLPLNSDLEDDEVFVAVNGYRYQIRRGEEVEVPRFVADVLKDSERQKLEAARYMKGLQQKAGKK